MELRWAGKGQEAPALTQYGSKVYTSMSSVNALAKQGGAMPRTQAALEALLDCSMLSNPSSEGLDNTATAAASVMKDVPSTGAVTFFLKPYSTAGDLYAQYCGGQATQQLYVFNRNVRVTGTLRQFQGDDNVAMMMQRRGPALDSYIERAVVLTGPDALRVRMSLTHDGAGTASDAWSKLMWAGITKH